ncbi:MAG: PAC2 family protein [Sedimentisphaerales bacterium]|nr:PAC2 family protein [Sedimentisphaerales bacterium]
MANDQLQYDKEIGMHGGNLLVGFTGWMDGGDVSTGTVEYIIRALGADSFAQIKPENFYIYNFPGTMEFSALFRPHCKIEDGIIRDFAEPSNIFYAAPDQKLLLFEGKEPNLMWRDYTDCIFSVCEKYGVQRVVFIGSVAGLTPHNRDPRFLCNVSEQHLGEEIIRQGMRLSEYTGPAGVITYLTLRSHQAGLEMISLVAEIPAYVQGYNPRCIEAAVRQVSALLGIQVPIQDLRSLSEEFEKRLDAIVAEQPELLEKVQKLEEDYDEQVFDNEMGDLKTWLQQKGIRLD